MGFDAKGVTEPLGMLRIAAIVCIILQGWLCPYGAYGHGFFFFVVCEVVFMILGCIGLGDNDIVKLIDKIFHLIAAIIVLFVVIMWFLDMLAASFGGHWKCLVTWILNLAIGIIFATITSMIWK